MVVVPHEEIWLSDSAGEEVVIPLETIFYLETDRLELREIAANTDVQSRVCEYVDKTTWFAWDRIITILV